LKKIIFILLITFSIYSKSQDTLSIFIQNKSLELIQNKDWKELQKLAYLAFNNDIDTYETRMILGIAYYEQKKYNLSLKEFISAKKISHNDYVDLYIYKSYLYGGHISDAEEYTEELSDSLKLSLSLKKSSVFYSLFINYGNSINTDYSDKIVSDYPESEINVSLQDKYSYIIDLNLRIHTLPHYFTTFAISKYIKPSTKYEINSNITKKTNDEIIDNIYHFLINYESIHNKAYFRIMGSNKTGSLSGGFICDFDYIGLGFSTSIYNSFMYSHNSAGIYFYPKANRNFIFSFEPQFELILNRQFSNNNIITYKNSNLLYHFKLYSNINKKLNIELQLGFGQSDIAAENGYLSNYGNMNTITQYYRTNINYMLTSKLRLFASASYFITKFSYKETSVNNTNCCFFEHITNYKTIENIPNINITFGLMWYF